MLIAYYDASKRRHRHFDKTILQYDQYFKTENIIFTECVEILDGHTTNKIYPREI